MDIELYDFSEHLGSIEWIDSLPRGLVSEQIDITHTAVSITKQEDGYMIYVGPKNADEGGDGIMITLDDNFQLVDYVIERIAPVPR